MKALELLKEDRDYCLIINNDKSIIEKYDKAIQELEDLQNSINSSIKEIEYALVSDYSNVYLNNALRFLKGEQ